MPPLLYLDTARLGQMCSTARDAQLDFVRLTAEEPSSLYFEEFLRGGFSAWPTSYQHRFPRLGIWNGVSGLRKCLLQLAGAPANWQVMLANRSLSLVNLAVRCQFRVCRHVLTTDLSWPTYQHALDHHAAATANRVTTTPLRERVLRQGWTASDVVEHLAQVFHSNRCDGLFLPAVDHLGIRLPIREICQRMEHVAELRFVFIDAAQAFCQVPIDECIECADFVVTGAHKWMQAYLPMGMGFFGKRRSRHLIARRLQLLRRQGRTNDPLLDFTEQLENGNLDSHFETANLTCLFSVAGASADRPSPDPATLKTTNKQSTVFQSRLANQHGDWRHIYPSDAMRSWIDLFEPCSTPVRHRSPDDMRRHWLDQGCILSAYPGGMIRISAPIGGGA